MEGTFTSELQKADDPKSARDVLGRGQFADDLTRSLLELPHNRSHVTGVFGAWGNGKTWILERVCKKLEPQKSVQLIRFSPWEMRSSEQVLAEFFASISQYLPDSDGGDDSSQSTKSLWGKLCDFSLIGQIGASGMIPALTAFGMESMVGLPGALGAISALAGKAANQGDDAPAQTTAQVRDQLANQLSKLERPLLVFIDDLDRLPDQSVQLMIQLINSVANLPKIHYVIFGDRQQIANALDPICGGCGDQFLEKIVHSPFTLPPSSPEALKTQLFFAVGSLLSSDITANYTERLETLWGEMLSFRLKNLRDIYRLLRAYEFSLKPLWVKGHLNVCPVDLLSIEFIKVFDPPTFRYLSECDFFSFLRSLAGGDEQKVEECVAPLFDKSLLSEACLRGFLTRTLGAKIRNSDGIVSHSDDSDTLSIRSFECYARYFFSQIGDGSLPEHAIAEFCASLDDFATAEVVLSDLRNQDFGPQLFYRLAKDLSLLDEGNRKQSLLKLLARVGDQFGRSGKGLGSEEQAANHLFHELVDVCCSSEAELQSTLKEFCDDPEYGFAFPSLLLEYSREKANEWFSKGGRPPEQLAELAVEELNEFSEQLVTRCLESLDAVAGFFYLPNGWRAYRIAHALGAERTEKIFRKLGEGKDQTWLSNLIDDLARDPSLRSQSVWRQQPEPLSENGHFLLRRLLQFASLPYWEKLELEGGISSIHQPIDTVHILDHVKQAIVDIHDRNRRTFNEVLFTKIGSSPVEVIRFHEDGRFEYKSDTGSGADWTEHQYILHPYCFELVWNEGAIYRCQWDDAALEDQKMEKVVFEEMTKNGKFMWVQSEGKPAE